MLCSITAIRAEGQTLLEWLIISGKRNIGRKCESVSGIALLRRGLDLVGELGKLQWGTLYAGEMVPAIPQKCEYDGSTDLAR